MKSEIGKMQIADLTSTAKMYFPEKVAYYSKIMNVNYGRITIRHQKTRWGSCSKKGNLNFNCLLMLAPEYVRDYVVVHELAHRKEMNHSQNFWSIVEEVIPNYRTSKKWLKKNGVELIQKCKF